MRTRWGLVAMGVLLMTSCGVGAGTPVSPPGSQSSAAASSTPAPGTTPRKPPPPPATTTARPTTAGETADRPIVVLDPGHNGGNAAAPERINRQVPAGRGRTKACNTTGTATDDGYPEHAFAFDVTLRVRRALAAHGVTVVLTRTDDTRVGPCVNRRAAIGNENAADAVVSIHADGHPDPSARGFHIIYSSPPLNRAQGEPALRLARTMRTALRSAGFPLSDYIGAGDGMSPRDDIAGMNLSERPAVMVECGNMRNADEAAAMRTPDGRQRYADAITAGILLYLGAE